MNTKLHKRFGQIVVKRKTSKRSKNGTIYWECLCDCGTILNVMTHQLKGHKSCQKCARLRQAKAISIHGLSKHPLYYVWKNIKDRCNNKKFRQYTDYGGRGISICTEWKNNFKVFYDWAILNGYKKELEIDRKDNDGNYNASNCHFITHHENNKNKRIYKRNKTGYAGVIPSQNGKKFKSFRTVNGKQKYFGTFDTAIEAANARKLKTKEVYH